VVILNTQTKGKKMNALQAMVIETIMDSVYENMNEKLEKTQNRKRNYAQPLTQTCLSANQANALRKLLA
jgi:hypothetical protein